MPKRKDLKNVLIIGAGPIVIGQACEFDYSGTQACIALKEEGIKVILINSNPATIMTDSEIADEIYIEPIEPENIQRIIINEKVDAILPTMGGQTAINITMHLYRTGWLQKNNIEIIGARPDSIMLAENRMNFLKLANDIGLKTPKGFYARSFDEAMEHLEKLDLPVNIRPSYILGGKGGGIASDKNMYEKMVKHALYCSPDKEILIEKSIEGWKEYELEIVRDRNDNCIVVCSIENVNPVGVHTGDSITVAPALTLTDKEYQEMRDKAFKLVRAVGVETGGVNVQFAVEPNTGEQVVIEINPRVSRSSALASKATGYPIARVSTKLAIGYTLDEIEHHPPNKLSCAFEPTLDYVVVKIPKFHFKKFIGISNVLSTSMRSVGEVMAIGKNFCEALQKAVVALEEGYSGLDEVSLSKEEDLKYSSSDLLFKIGQAFRNGMSISKINALTKWDKWFLFKIQEIISIEKELILQKDNISKTLLRVAKCYGFTNLKIAQLTNNSESYINEQLRKYEIEPIFKRVDCTSGEIDIKLSYLYATYDILEQPYLDNCESYPSARKKVIVIGSGANRIGQGIEFDYSCVHATKAIMALNYECIMINCNPETVSTDFDIADKLYFIPLSVEEIFNVIQAERKSGEVIGVILQFGGQTSINLIKDLEDLNVPVLGIDSSMIDLTEDRKKFSSFVEGYCKQPANKICYTIEQMIDFFDKSDSAIIIRPSYIIGGSDIKIIEKRNELIKILDNNEIDIKQGILVEKFLKNALELEVDILSDGNDIYVTDIMEQLECSGIHSGDSSCIIPACSITNDIADNIYDISSTLTKNLGVTGLINIQYAFYNNEIYILEINPRASRTVPFVSKSIKVRLPYIATQIMLGKSLKDFALPNKKNHQQIFLKKPVFSFDRFEYVHTRLGPEMKSTGESMSIGKNLTELVYANLSLENKTLIKEAKNIIILIQESNCNESFNKIIRQIENTEITMHILRIYCNQSLEEQLSQVETLINRYNIKILIHNLDFYISSDEYYLLLKKYQLSYFNSLIENIELLRLIYFRLEESETKREKYMN